MLRIFVPLAFLVSGSAVLIYQSEVDHQHTERARREHESMRAGAVSINRTLNVIGRDLIYLARHRQLNRLINNQSGKHVRRLTTDWVAFSQASRVYDKIRWIDEKGREKLRVDYAEPSPKIVLRSKLQYKGDRYFFKEAMHLAPNKIFVSPLDLNMEHGRVEVPHRPTIRFAMPVFDRQGKRRGIIMINYSASSLLKRFEEETGVQRNTEWLVNDEGYWLKGSSPEEEFGFMLERDDLNMAKRYPEAWKAIQTTEGRQFESNEGLWTFTTIRPLQEWSKAGGSVSGSLQIATVGGADSERYVWKSVSLLPTEQYDAGLFVYGIKLGIGTFVLLVLFFIGARRIAQAHAYKKMTHHRLVENEARLRTLMHNIPDMIWMKDEAGVYRVCNPAFLHHAGISEQAIIGKTDHEVLPPELADRYRKDDLEVIESGKERTKENSVINFADGRPLYLETIKVPVKTEEGQLLGVLGIAHNITERKHREEEIWRNANFDALTGLPNRRMFQDRLEQAILKARRSDSGLALLFLDLDHFKDVNDTMGHHIGDILLQVAAQRLRHCVRESDVIARFGGDEFVVLLEDSHPRQGGERVTQKILDMFVTPFELDGQSIYVSASIGITFYPDDADHMEDLLRNADQAMYAAKKGGRNRYHCFTHDMDETVQRRAMLLGDLRTALIDKPFELHYQPIVDLRTGEVHKVEALIRWQHAERGMISPGEFIPLAEETGMIGELSNWVFHEAVRQAMTWRVLMDTDFQITINLSSAQFRSDDDMLDAWMAHLLQIGLPGNNIGIEITERLLLDANPQVFDRFMALRDAGIQVAIDDFGTGYSSLSYLKKFDIDYLKIDRSFIQNLSPGSTDMALCEAIIVMAHKLGLMVVAEGVETRIQCDLLKAAGCDYGQGYLFSRPLPAAQLELWMASLSSGKVVGV